MELKTKLQSNKLTENIKKKLDIPTYLSFLMLFIYGLLLLMVGYTQKGLSTVLFPDSTGEIVYALIAQSAGLIIATLVISRLLARFNIRWIFLTGYLIAAVMLVLISQIDHLGLASGSVGIVALFIVFSFIFGCGIGPMSPLVSTFLSAKYKDPQQATLLSVSNGIYGIGAGIIPLVAASAIINLGTKDSSGNVTFDSVRYFYYIALGFAILGALVGFFINYQHSAQLTSSKILDKKEKSFNIWKPIIMAIIIMSAYMIIETISNYMFTNIAQSAKDGKFDISSNAAITATRAFGLFVMVQGLWRAASGIWIVNRMKKSAFLMISLSILGVAFLLMLLGLLKHDYMQYIVAVLVGIGLGNCWPMIYSYSIDIDPRRATFIGMVINITSMFWIPVTQLFVAPIWTASTNSNVVGDALYYAPIIIGIIFIGIAIALIAYSIFYFKSFRQKQGIKE